MSAGKGALAVLLAAALLGLVVALAWSRAEAPARCAPGMTALGARCCGEGQRLADGARCAGAPGACAAGMRVAPEGCVAPARVVELAGGTLRVGPGDWEAQGVVEPRVAELPRFGLDALEVTAARYAPCAAAGACARLLPAGEPGLPVSGVTLDEAARFCAWAGGALPTSDQLAFAAAGTAGRRYAWGDTGAVCRRAAWGLVEGPCARGAVGPELAGSHPDGASPDGVLDLAGNVAEWTLPRPASPETAEVRGGSWRDGAASALRAWQRRVLPVRERAADVGFRCAYARP